MGSSGGASRLALLGGTPVRDEDFPPLPILTPGERAEVAAVLALPAWSSLTGDEPPGPVTRLEQALAVARDIGDDPALGGALIVRGMAARAVGEHDHAVELLEQSLGMSRAAGHRPGIYTSLYLLASVHRVRGNDHAAVELLVKRDVRGFGVETINTDAGQAFRWTVPYPCHTLMHGANKYGLQCLTNLDQLPPTGAIVLAAPLKIKEGSGSPLRVLALVAH